MVYPFLPLIDDTNPLYCPDLSASEFLSHYLPSCEDAIDDASRLSFYARISLCVEESGCFGHVGCANSAATALAISTKYTLDAHVKREYDSNPSYNSSLGLSGAPKKARSNLSQSDSSFVLSAKADRLRFPSVLDLDSSFYLNANDAEDSFIPYREPGYNPNHGNERNTKCRVSDSRRDDPLEDSFYGPNVGADTPRSRRQLISRLSKLLPGLRLQETLCVKNRSHQDIVDFLAGKGHLNPQVLDLFRRSNITHLDLTESVCDEGGLNVTGKEVLRILQKPNSFVHLSSINLSGTPLDNFDLTMLHHLPRLESLHLDNTQIGNEAVMHLVALKHSLLELNLAINPQIDDDAIPSICALGKLEALSLRATTVTMDGIRKLSNTLTYERRYIRMEIPFNCTEYLQELDSHYVLDPAPPLIVDPSACVYLSNAALKRNLEAHASAGLLASSSSEIGTGYGSRPDMIQKLKSILETRKSDLIARELMFGDHDSDLDMDS